MLIYVNTIPDGKSVLSSLMLKHRYMLSIIGRQSEGSVIWGFVNQKWVPYLQRYLFNAIPDTNHNASPTNPNHYSKGNPNPNRYQIIELSDYRYITMLSVRSGSIHGFCLVLFVDCTSKEPATTIQSTASCDSWRWSLLLTRWQHRPLGGVDCQSKCYVQHRQQEVTAQTFPHHIVCYFSLNRTFSVCVNCHRWR